MKSKMKGLFEVLLRLPARGMQILQESFPGKFQLQKSTKSTALIARLSIKLLKEK